METANTDQPEALPAEPVDPYSAFRNAQNKLMHDFLGGLGSMENHLIQHDRGWERKIEGLRVELQERDKEIIRLSTELSHRPAFPGWGFSLQDMGERPIDAPAIEGAQQAHDPAEQTGHDGHLTRELQAAGEHIARLEADLASERANVTRLESELATEKDSTERLERDNRRLEEKIEDDQREVLSQGAARQAEAAEAAHLLAVANDDRARLAEEVAQLTEKVSEEQGLRGDAEAKAAQAAEAADAEKGRVKALQDELDALRDAPTPPPAEVDVAAVRAEADEEAKIRMATIVAAIEEANPGISLHHALELFAAAWEAPRTEPDSGTGQEVQGPEQPASPEAADLFDFTLPPPSEDDEIPYVPHAEAVGAQSQ